MSEFEPELDANYVRRLEILDALDLPEVLVPLQNHYWDKRREFRKLEESCLRMVESILEMERLQASRGGDQ